MKRTHSPYILLFAFILFISSCGAPTTESSSASVADDSAKEAEEYKKQAPDWSKNATIYEVNVRQYTNEGTFRAFQEHLPRLEEMGIDILWFMPIHPIGVENRKGGLGSYYSVKDYKGINPEFGTMDEFVALVEDAHSRGMKVIIDWVANHTAWDAVWIQEGHMDWYTLDSLGGLQPPIGTDWSDVVDLNFENEDMRLAMIDAMSFWLKEADIDGFRCDVAEWVPDDFWNQARPALDAVKPVFMLAEAEHVEHHEKAFDMSYAWEWHFVMNEFAQGTKDATDVLKYLEKEQRFPTSAYRLNMTSNHDENTWKGTVKERLGDGIQTTAVLSATLFGMPLVYSGQEASLDHRLEFFEKDSIDWTEKPLQGFYTRLMELNHNNRALWNGDHGASPEIISSMNDPRVIAYSREKDGDKVVVLLNMSDTERSVSLDISPTIEGFYEELFTGEEVELREGYTETMGPWYYKVYHIETQGS